MYSCYYLYTAVLSYGNIAWVISSGIETALRKEYKNHGCTEQILIKIYFEQQRKVNKESEMHLFLHLSHFKHIIFKKVVEAIRINR